VRSSAKSAFLFLSSLLLLAGCAEYACHEDRMGECHAISVAWDREMKEDVDPPSVEWRMDRCDAEPQVPMEAVVVDGMCYAGLFYENGWKVLVAYTPPDKMSQTALIHELMHAHMARLGLYDPEHQMTYYWDWVNRINDELRTDGF
jgi:hypothetical protein